MNTIEHTYFKDAW